MVGIQPLYVSLGTLLAGRLFRIPEYQRAYSWHRKQRTDLFNDIEKVAATQNDSVHFMATVVGLRRETRTIITDEHQVVEVVDGQQRLTTLVILLKAAAEALKTDDKLEARIRRELEEALVKPDEHSLLLLQPTTTRATTLPSTCVPDLISHWILLELWLIRNFWGQWPSARHSLSGGASPGD